MSGKRTKTNVTEDLVLELDATLVVNVASAAEAKDIAARVKRGEMPLSLQVTYGEDSNMLMLDVYPDTPGCTLKFTGPSTGILKCTVKGRMVVKAEENGLSAADVAALTEQPVVVKGSIVDSNFDALPAEGGEDGLVVVGTASVPAKGQVTMPQTKKADTSKVPRSNANADKAVIAAIDLALGGMKAAKAEIARMRKLGEEPDYALEAHLEALTRALETSKQEVSGYLASIGSSLEALGVALRSPWLDTDIAGWELRVRAAEALGAWSKASGESLEIITKRLGSKDPCERMWAARAIRALKPTNEAALLKRLERDPFEDDNGLYLVREAAGFEEG